MLSAIKGLIARETTTLIREAKKYSDMFESDFWWAFKALPIEMILIYSKNLVFFLQKSFNIFQTTT